MSAIVFGGSPVTFLGSSLAFGATSLTVGHPRFRLEADGLEPLEIDCGAIAGVRFDLGDAVTREVVMDMPSAHGTIDTTEFTGSRVVTLEVLVDSHISGGTRWALTQQLRKFTHPRLRPRLFVQFGDADAELMLTLRRSQFSDTWGPADAGRSNVVVQWVCPSGIIESAEEHTASASASATAPILGRTYDREYNRTYITGSAPQGSVMVTNAGDTDAYPIIRLYGPWSGTTTISNDLTEKDLILSGQTVLTGDYIELDTRNKTIRHNGTDDRYSALVYPGSQWWTLVPGEQRIRFSPGAFNAPAYAELLWRDAWY